MQSKPVQHQDVLLHFVGQSLWCLVGELKELQHDLNFYDILDPPETHNTLLLTLAYAAEALGITMDDLCF
jgi:hypothetical protein